MTRRTRRRFSADEELSAVRRHLIDKPGRKAKQDDAKETSGQTSPNQTRLNFRRFKPMKIATIILTLSICAPTLGGDVVFGTNKVEVGSSEAAAKNADYRRRMADRRRIALETRRNLYGGKKYNRPPVIPFGITHRYVQPIYRPVYRSGGHCRPSRRSFVGRY